jgi:CheY-like chemotaxis protein
VTDRAKRILIVDDDADFRTVIRTVLEGEGCTVNEAPNGKVALNALCEALPDLIILDLDMPVMNGWDFCCQVQKDPRLAAIPIAVLSSVTQARPCGSMHVIQKPIRLAGLLGLLHAIDAPNQPRDSTRPPAL